MDEQMGMDEMLRAREIPGIKSNSRNAWGQGIDNPGELAREGAQKALDAAKGEIAKEEAISRVEANASRAWLDEAWLILQAERLNCIRAAKRRMTSDDVWQGLHRAGVADPHEPRAMGVVMRRAIAEGLLAPTLIFVPSDLPQNHRRPVRVYEVVR